MNNESGKLNFSVGLDNTRLRQDAAETRRILEGIGDSTEKESNRMKDSFNGVGKVVAGIFATQQLINFGRAVIDVRSQIQSLEVSFTTLLGSQEKAKKLFGEIRDYAVKTPMQLGDLAKGAQTLLSFNMEAEKVMPTLRALGDVSMGDAQKFQSLTLAFAQIQSTGKLMGQDLLQLINAGFNPLSVISGKTGKSIGVLKEEMSKGAISAEMVTDAFMSATSEGGKFYGMLDAQSKTMTGSLSNLKGAWDDMLNDIGQKSEGVFLDAVNFATECIKNYEAFINVILSLAAAYGTYKAALMATVVIEQARALLQNIQLVMMFRKELGLLTAAQQAFNVSAMKNPYILLASAIIGVITALALFIDTEDEADARIKECNARLEEQAEEMERLSEAKDSLAEVEKKAAQSTAEEINKIEILSNTIRDNTASLDDRKRAIAQMQSIVPSYHAELDEEGRLHNENTNAIDEHIKSLQRLAMARALQSKREEVASQIVNAEIDRRTAKKNEQDAQTKVDETTAQADSARQKYESRMDEWEGATTRSDSWIVRGAFSSQEGQIAMQGISQSESQSAQLDATRKAQQAAEAELAVAQGEVALADKRIETANQELAVLDEMLRDYSDVDVTGGTTITTTTTTTGGKDKAPVDSTLSRMNYAQDTGREVREAELDIEQERINAMEEGVDKYLAQSELAYKRMKEANRQREEDMVAELRAQRQQEWENANPNATEEEKNAHAISLQSSVTTKDLSEAQLKVIKEYNDIAEQYRRDANAESINIMLDGVKTYEQQRTAIAEEYERKRQNLYQLNEDGSYKTDEGGNKVLREGVSQGNVDELNYQEQEALAAIDQQFAAREVTFQAWMDSVANMTLEQLNAVLAQAETELAALEKQNPNDPKLAQARAKVTTLKEKVADKNARAQTSPDKRSLEDWNELRGALEDCIDSFEEVGDAVGGVAGEIISVTGSIMGSTLSMINGIVQLVQMSSTGMVGTATAASTAIATVEKASVILAVISAAMQIAMQIINLFNNDDKKQEEIEALQGRIDQLQWELDNADIMKLRENNINSLQMVRDKLNEVTMSLIQQRLAAGDLYGFLDLMHGGAINDTEALSKTIDELAVAYGNVAYTADKALGGGRYKKAQDDLKNIAEQQLLIQQQINAEASKKKTDEGQIEEWERQIEELGAQAIQLINDMVEDIIGGSAVDIANELGEAFFEAFEAGEDAAEAWGEKVNDIVGDIMKRMLIQKFLEEPLGEIFNKYKEKWFPDGDFAGIDAVTESLTDFSSDLQSVGGDFAQIWDALPEEIKNIIGGTTAAREASQEGIASASQESVDELNGRMTAVQSHTYSINESMKSLVQTATLILASVLNIEDNTDNMERRMSNIEGDLGEVKQTVNDIAIKGIKIR